MKTLAKFPESIWDGLAKRRPNLNDDKFSDSSDHDQIVAEVRAIEAYLGGQGRYLGTFETILDLPSSAEDGDFALVYEEWAFFAWEELTSTWEQIGGGSFTKRQQIELLLAEGFDSYESVNAYFAPGHTHEGKMMSTHIYNNAAHDNTLFVIEYSYNTEGYINNIVTTDAEGNTLTEDITYLNGKRTKSEVTYVGV